MNHNNVTTPLVAQGATDVQCRRTWRRRCRHPCTAPADPHERSTISRAIAMRLREMREARGWSQTDVADRLGIDRPLVARTEGGRHLITLDLLARYAAIYECPIASIVSAADVALAHISPAPEAA